MASGKDKLIDLAVSGLANLLQAGVSVFNLDKFLEKDGDGSSISKGVMGVWLIISIFFILVATWVISDKDNELDALKVKLVKADFKARELEKKYSDLEAANTNLKESHAFYVDLCELKTKKESNEVQRKANQSEKR